MTKGGGLIVAAAALFLPLSQARAGAWPQPAGHTQAILKYERQEADHDYDTGGDAVGRGQDRLEEDAVLYVEHGLTERLTLQGKASLTRGHDGGTRYQGRGPVELGLRANLWRGEATVLSGYLGVDFAGRGFNAEYAPPGAGDIDVEARLLAGRSGRIGGRPVFGEVQLGWIERQDLADEARLDATFGIEPASGWLVMAQGYAGRAFAAGGDPRWLKLEGAVVRRLGRWSLQGGWRQTVAGRRLPRDGGPVIGVWLDF